MAKEKVETKPEIAAVEGSIPTPPPNLPPGASLGEDGILELDPRRQVTEAELSTSRINCYFSKADGKCLQGPKVRTGYHYVSVPPDLAAPAKDAAVQERLALGYVRVEGVYIEGIPGALIMRQPEVSFQRIRDAKHARAMRQNKGIAKQGEAEIAGTFASAERSAPKEA